MPSNKWKKFKKNAKNKKTKPKPTVEEVWQEASRKLRESPILGVPHTSDRSILRARLYEVLNMTPSPVKSDGADGNSSPKKSVELCNGTQTKRALFEQDENPKDGCTSTDTVNGIADAFQSPLKKKSKLTSESMETSDAISCNQEGLAKNRSDKSLNISKNSKISFESSNHTTFGLGEPSVLPTQSPRRNLFSACNSGVVSGFKTSSSDFKKPLPDEKTRHNNDSRDLFDEWSDANSVIAEKIQPFTSRKTDPRQISSSWRSRKEHSDSSDSVDSKSSQEENQCNELLSSDGSSPVSIENEEILKRSTVDEATTRTTPKIYKCDNIDIDSRDEIVSEKTDAVFSAKDKRENTPDNEKLNCSLPSKLHSHDKTCSSKIQSKLKSSNCNPFLVSENNPTKDYSQPSTSGIKKNVRFTDSPSKDKTFGTKRNETIIISSSSSNSSSSSSSNSSISFNSDVSVTLKRVSFADKDQTIKDFRKPKVTFSEDDRLKIKMRTKNTVFPLTQSGTVATEREIEMINAVIHETCETKLAVSFRELKKFKRHCVENGRNDLWQMFKSTDKYKMILSLMKYGDIGNKKTRKNEGESSKYSKKSSKPKEDSFNFFF